MVRWHPICNRLGQARVRATQSRQEKPVPIPSVATHCQGESIAARICASVLVERRTSCCGSNQWSLASKIRIRVWSVLETSKQEVRSSKTNRKRAHGNQLGKHVQSAFFDFLGDQIRSSAFELRSISVPPQRNGQPERAHIGSCGRYCARGRWK